MSKIQLDDMVSPEEQLPLSIQYVEKDRIPIRFWTLFIHLPSLNREVGLLKDFGHKHAGWGSYKRTDLVDDGDDVPTSSVADPDREIPESERIDPLL
ncbi:MAG: hypothetical protein IPJ06_00730 [Saprospiraceae bacterium]|nr:hypothetical protein [Saprospiraceae bacterium]